MIENQANQQPVLPPKNQKPSAKPQETGAVHVEGFIKIHDPNTKEVHLESRA